MTSPSTETRNGSKAAKCRIRACAGAIEAKGLCRKHYRWERMYGDATHEPPRGGPKVSPAALDDAGITRAQRNYWCNTGILRAPLDPDTGRRVWTAGEVRVAVLLIRLINAGVNLNAAVAIARDVVERSTNIHDLGQGISLVVRESAAQRSVTAW